MMPPEPCVKILFVGDMHLGRLPSRVPPSVLKQGALEPRDLGPAGAWKRIVDAAIEQKVNAVALAGDLVERDNALFEAYGPLATGVRRLVDKGIIVAGVAGNHDTRVLPRLADEIEDFRLLGPDGTWSTLDVSGDGGMAVTLSGWSFPAQHHRESPLRTSPPPPTGITLGLLHADLDQAGSDYAPVRSADLKAVGYHGWFLGHVHIPGAVPAPFDGSPFYLGSVTGLDPNETGLRGPVLVQVSRGGKIEAARLPLAPLRWEHRDLDCSALVDPASELEALLLNGLAQLFDDALTELDEVRALGIRFQLTGAVDDPAALEKTRRELDTGNLVTERQGTVLFIQKVSSSVTPRIHLPTVAGRADPPGLLARQILALEKPGRSVPEVADSASLANELIGEARQALVPVDRDAAFIDLVDPDEEISDEDLRRMLLSAARLALAGLLAQPTGTKGADHAAG